MASALTTAVRFAIIGMGGYAAAHHHASVKLESQGLARLVATCDPNPGLFEEARREWRFHERGIEVFDDYVKMLDAMPGGIDMVVIPTPIFLHAEMHSTCVGRGLAVYLEKPPTLVPDELDMMIQESAAARYSTQVGFNFIIQPQRHALKQRLIAGEFGRVLAVTVLGQWPRPEAYFRRNGWAGKLVMPDGRLVMDSCFGNAMSHFIHNALFWAGTGDVFSWGRAASVNAALFRAHSIQSPDTFFVETATREGVTLRIGLTHACFRKKANRETIYCEKARLVVDPDVGEQVIWRDGRHEARPALEFDAVTENLAAYMRYLLGEVGRPATLLTDALPFVELHALAYLAAERVVDFSACGYEVQRHSEGGTSFRSVEGLSGMLNSFVETGAWPTKPVMDRKKATAGPPVDLAGLQTVIRRMASDSLNANPDHLLSQ